MFKDAIPCGLKRRQLSEFGRKIHVNPHPDTVIEASNTMPLKLAASTLKCKLIVGRGARWKGVILSTRNPALEDWPTIPLSSFGNGLSQRAIFPVTTH